MFKNIVFVAFAGIGIVFFSNGCKKPDDVVHAVYSSEDHAICQTLFADVVKVMDNIVNDLDELRGDICVNVIEIDTTGLPLTLFIDYGDDECESQDGRVRTGELYAQFTGRYNEEGAQITISPNGYRVDDYSINGQISITNLAENASGFRERSFVVTSGEVRPPDNSFTLNWECDQTMEFTEGEVSWFFIDDLHSISGISSGTNRNGVEYDAEISTPIEHGAVCRWFEIGDVAVQPAGRQIRQLTFGVQNGQIDGCNNLATVVVEGISYTITLP
jgi:hypothetical protein